MQEVTGSSPVSPIRPGPVFDHGVALFLRHARPGVAASEGRSIGRIRLLPSRSPIRSNAELGPKRCTAGRAWPSGDACPLAGGLGSSRDHRDSTIESAGASLIVPISWSPARNGRLGVGRDIDGWFAPSTPNGGVGNGREGQRNVLSNHFTRQGCPKRHSEHQLSGAGTRWCLDTGHRKRCPDYALSPGPRLRGPVGCRARAIA